MVENKFIEKIDKLVGLLPNYHNVLEGNEAQTRWLLIDPFILDCWGYSREDVIVEYSVDKEERVTKYDALDYCVLKDKKPKILIEAKSLGVDLYSKFEQLSDYFITIYNNSIYNQNELIGVLTDGDLYLFFTDIKEKGVLYTEPFFTVRLSISENIEILRLMDFSKENIISFGKVDEEDTLIDYDLKEYYRVDMIEAIFNNYESKGVNLEIDSLSIRGRKRVITSFRGLYREIVKEINNIDSKLLYELAIKENESRVDGSVQGGIISLNFINDSIKIKTSEGLVYLPLSRTRKGMIDRIVYILKQSNLGLFNVLVKLKQK